MENSINPKRKAEIDAFFATNKNVDTTVGKNPDDAIDALAKDEEPTEIRISPQRKSEIDAFFSNNRNDTEGSQVPVVDTVGQKLQQQPTYATTAMPQEPTVPMPTAEEAQSGNNEKPATPYRIPTFRTQIAEQPKTDSLMADIDARVDAVADELEKRYAEDERNRIKGRPLSERVFDAYETNDSPIAKSIGDMSAARQATGADRIIKDVMTFNDEQKAQLNTAIAEQVASDRDYQDAKSELEDVIKSVGADKPQVSDKDAAEIMKSLTPEQRKAAEAEIERVQAEIARATNVFNIVSQDVAQRVSSKVNNDIVSRIIDRLATRNMPKSDMEYIGKAIYNNSIAGMLYETAVKAASGSSWVDYAVSAKGLERYDASTAAKITGSVGALLADSGIFSILSIGGGAAAGAITNLATRIVAGRIAQGATTTLAKGALQQTAKRIATSRAITRLASNVIAQSATLGSYDAASSILQQNLANPEGIDWVEVLKRAGTGAASGAAVGGIGVATQAVKGLPRMDALKAKGLPMDIAIGSLGLLAENAAFVGIGSLASGEDADLQSFAEGLATLGILKGVGMLKSGMRNPSNRVRTFAERTLNDLRFTPEEEAAFRKAGIAENGLSIIRSAVEHAGETTTTEESAGTVRDTYNEVMASKEIPLSAKVKLQYIVTGQVQNVPDVVKMELIEPEGDRPSKIKVNSYDSRGRLLSVSEFADIRAARAYINKYSSLVERNSIAQYEQMVNGVSNLVAIDRAARRYAAENNADAQEIFNDILIAKGIVKGDLPSDERLVRVAEVENMARNSGRDFLRDIVRRVAVRNEASSQEVMQAMNVKPYLRTEKEKRLVADYVKEIKGFVGRPVDIRPPKPNTTGRIEAGAQTPAEPAPDVAPQNPQTPPRPSVDDAMRAQIEDSVRSLSKLNSDEIVSVNIGSSPFGSGTAVVREGYVILDENGDIDPTLSDSTVVVEFEDGRRATVSIDDIDEVTYQGDTNDMVNRAVERQEQAMQMLGNIDTYLGNGQSVVVRLIDGTEGIVSGIDEYENYIFTTTDEQGNEMALPLTGAEIVDIRPIETPTENTQSEQATEDVADVAQEQGSAPSVEDAEQPQTVEPEYDEDFPPLTDADFAPVIDYDTVKWAELSPKDWTDTMRLYASQNSENPDAMVVRSARSYYNNSKSKVANADKRIAAKDKEIERLRAGLDRAANPQETIKQSKRIQKAQEERNALVRSKDAIAKEMAQYEYALREYGIDVQAEESLLREQVALQQERAELVEADADLERTNDELALQEMKTIVNTEQNRKKVYDLYVARGVTPEQAGLRQAILWDIATGNVRLRWEDGQTPSGAKTKGLASELGLGGSASDKRAYKSIVSRDGMSVDEYVHSLWEQRGGYTNDLDDMEMKNEVLDVLQGAPNGSRALEQLYEMLGIAADREEGFGQSKADIERRIKDVDARIADNQQAIMEFNKRVNDVIGGLETNTAGISNNSYGRNNEKFGLHPISQTEESVPLDDSRNLTPSDNQTSGLGINSSELSIGKDSNNSAEKVSPVGESGFGFVYDQFKGDANGAIRQLMKMQDGEAVGALHHKEIGDIDLVWGKAGTKHSDDYGLAKIVRYHPEVLDNLQGILDDMQITQRTDNRVQLENEEYQAAVRLTWNGEGKTWLLTAFKKKETSEPTNSSTDVDSNLNGKSDDTATRQGSNVSIDKYSNNSAEKQEKTEKVEAQRQPLADEQGNPLNADGTLMLDEVLSIDELEDKDFSEPYRNVQLPTLPANVNEAIGADNKPVIIKKSIFEKNRSAHKFTSAESRAILTSALYNTDLTGRTQPSKKPLNWVVIKIDEKSPIVVLEVNNEKNNTEIVGWYTLDERNLERIKRQAHKNGGELIMLSPKDKVESLSTPLVGLSSDNKDSNNSAEKQEKAEKVEQKPAQSSARTANVATSKPAAPSNKIEDYGEVIKGARKDAMKELAKSVDNATLESLISLPFAKAFKRPDLRKAVDEGALREQDARFAESVMAAYLSTKKPKADTKKDKYRKAVWGKSKVEVWADEAYKGVQLLKQLFEAEPAERDRIMAGAMAEHYTGVEVAKAHQERLKEWNPGKTFTGESYPINNVALFNEVFGRLDNDGGTTDIPVVGARPSTSYDSYLLVRPNGETLYPTHTLRTFEDVVDEVVYLTKLNNADADTEHPSSAFKVQGLDPQYQIDGYYVRYVPTLHSTSAKEKEFKTKEEADAFYEKITNEGKVAGGPYEIKSRTGYGRYEIVFKNPITDEWIETGIIRDSQADAIASIDQEHDALNKIVNDKLAEASVKTGKPKAAEYIQVRSYFDSGKMKYGVVIADKYGPKKTAFSTMPYYFAEGFSTRKEAEAALEKNRAEWEGFVKDIIRKRQEYVYFDGKNAPRVGKDYRGGKDVTEKDFAEAFGFRGVQFGNWTNQNDRQAAVNNAYDSFMDLANIIGVSPRALSLNGELGIAFGSRGSGKANAHYESDNVVINLTKTRGAGSLAHEWWHALDNYFARQAKVPAGFVTSDKKLAMREQLRWAFDDLIDDVAKSDYNERSRERGTYWGNPIEETARLFEEWVVDEQAKRGERNHFLAEGIGTAEADYAEMNYLYYKTATEMSNESRKRQGQEPEKVMSFEEFKKTPMALAGFVYPSAEELRTLGEDVRAIFDTVQERVDEQTGNVALFHRGDNSTTPPASVDADRWNAIVDMVKESVGAENVITNPEEVKAEYDHIMAGQQRVRERIVEDANSRFNEQLDRFADGTMPSGDKIQLGTPGATLLASGVQNSDMSITQRVLKEHLDKHNLSIEDIKNLPQALESPIMVYEWGKLAKSTIVITEIPRGDERIAVAIRFREAGNGIKINHIASIHGKSANRLLDEMTNGKSAFAADNLRYVDKEKVSHWLATGNSFGSSVSNEKLDSATKVVKEFENPKVEAGNLHDNDLRERIVEDANSRFNEQLGQQIAGTLPQGHIYQLGTPSPILLSCGIPNLPIELAASRLSDKSMQENHPFDLPEIEGLVDAIQNPLAVFRSATRIGSNVILTELKHGDKSFVVAIRTNQRRGRITVNSIRSIHYRNTDMNIVNWINEGLADYIKPTFAQEWLEPTTKKLRSKPQYNSADVRAQLKDVAKVVKEFENPKVEAENLRQCIVYHGSGADFEKFDHSHMGEGEGVQAYGWGTYVTEVNGIAKSYAEATAKGKSAYKGKTADEIYPTLFESEQPTENKIAYHILIKMERGGMTASQAIAAEKEDAATIYSTFGMPVQERLQAKAEYDILMSIRPEDFEHVDKNRNLYTVDIPDDNGQNYLKWNARIKGEQAKRILDWIENSPYKKAFDHEKHIYEQVGERFHPVEGRTGKDVYEFLKQIMYAPYAPEATGSADKRASQALSEMGFVGISYPAQYRSGGRSDGARNYVIFNENDAQIVDHERYLRTPNGEVYGFTVGGRIYLDSSKMNAETPIHEYTELWSKVVAENNPELWQRGKELLKETDTWKEVNADKNYKDLSEDERASETLSRIVAKDAAKKISEISDNKTIIAKLRAWLRQFWKDLKATFSKWSKDDLSKLKVDEFTKMPLRDLVEKVDLSKYTKARSGQARMAQDRAELDAVNAERESIVSRAKADGTYMKAPNGKPTELTERQWADVRTSRFKEWFGDWEKAAIANKLLHGESVAKLSGNEFAKDGTPLTTKVAQFYKDKFGGAVTREGLGEVILDERSVKDSMSHGIGRTKSAAFAAVPNIIKDGVVVDTQSNWKDRGYDSATIAAPVSIGDKDYIGLVVVKRSKEFNRFYLHEVFLKESLLNGDFQTGLNTGKPSGDIANVIKDIVSASKTASKVVDENGEPMVVYHGTAISFGKRKFDTFDTENAPSWFTPSKHYAEVYSKARKGKWLDRSTVYPAFLNIRNLKDVGFVNYGGSMALRDFAGQTSIPIEDLRTINRENQGRIYGDGNATYDDSVYMLYELTNSPQFRDYLIRKGYDGIKTEENEASYAVFSPNQIKSATDNVGTYDSRENDIRFMFAGEKGAVEADRVEEATTRMDNLAVARKMEADFKERPARLERLRNVKPVVITGREIEPSDDRRTYINNAFEYGKSLRGQYVNKDTGKTVELSRSGLKEVLHHDTKDNEQIQSIAAIPQMIENSVYITTIPNTDSRSSADSFDYYVTGLKIGGVDYTAKIVVANIDGKRYYDHKLTDIEKGNLIDLINKAPDSASNSTSSESSAKSGEISSDPIRIPNLNQEQKTIFAESGDVTNPIENPQSDAGKQTTLSDIKDKRLLDILQTSDKENAKRIKLATGWERGADGKWRYEIPDFDIYYSKFDVRNDEDFYVRKRPLKDVLTGADELFEMYPFLNKIKVRTPHGDSMQKLSGNYNGKTIIDLNGRFFGDESKRDDARATLMHEVQHVIQDIEGFASGGNPEMLERQNRARIKELSERKSAIEREIANGTPESEYEDELAEIDMELQDYNPDFGGYDHYRHLSGEVEARNVEKRMNMTPEERRASLAAETEDVAREDQIFLYDNLNATRSASISEPAEPNASVEDNGSQERTQVDALSAKIASLQAKARNRTQNVRELTAEVIRFVKDKANDEVLKNLGEQRFRSMMNGVQAAMMKIASDRITPERQRAEIRKQLDKIDTRITEASVKSNRDAIEKMLNLRVYKFNPMGVLMGNRISENTRQIFDIVQAGIANKSKSWNERENRYVYYYTLKEGQATTIEKLLGEIESQMYELPVEDNSVMHKIYAVQILQRYNNAITIHDVIDEINSNLNTAMADRSAAFRAKQAALEAGDADKHAEQLFEWRRLGEEIVGLQGDLLNRTHLYNDALAEFRQGLESLIKQGRNAWLDAVQQEAEERMNLMRTAFSSIRVQAAIPYKEKEIGKDVAETKVNRNNELRTLVSNALPAVATFDSMLRAICINDIGNRYGLYDKIMGGEDGLVFASDKQYKNKQMMFSTVEDKIKELGLGKDINVLIARSKKPTDMKIFNKGVPAREKHNGKIMRDGDGNIIFQMIELNVGELMYLYSSSRQEQGRKMLLNAGIDELQIDTIADYIADEFPKEKQFVDWVTDELLPTQRYERYNGLYEYLYKTQMPDTPHYFPLEVNKKQLYKAEEIGEEVTTLPTSTVGSIIARREHNYGLNLDTNFVDKLIGHINDMEHWYAFAKPIKQINTLLSSTQFRNVVEAQAKGAVSLLKRVANIAVGGNEPNQAGKLPKLLRAISRNDIAANITFRFNTALKQTLSYPAYFAYSASPRYWMYMAKAFNPKNIKANWVWAMNELPTVRERWESRSAGFDQFNANDIEVEYNRTVRKAVSAGMWANSAVDLLTCTVGARAIYEFEYSNNLKLGMSPKEADTDAKYRAALFLNQTQQSGDGIFLSRMQKTPVFSQLMAYRNANTGYARLEIHAVAEATRMLSGKTRKRLIDARKEYYKGQGMSDTAAEHKAKHDYWQNFLRALMVIGVFGGVLPWAWQKGGKGILGYQPNKDDDDKDNGVFFIPGLSDMPIYGPAVDDIYRNSQTGFGLRNMKFISAPTLETIKNNGLILWDRWRNGEKADSYDKTALFVAFSLGARFGLAFDAKTFDNMYHGVAGIIRDKSLDYEDAMEMLNSPRSAVKAVVGPIRKGETKDEYMQRLSFANRRIRSNDVLDKKIEKLYFENLNNKLYKEMGISPSEVKALSERVKEVKKRLHLTGTGYVQEDYMDKYDNLPAAQSALVDSLGNRIYDIYYYDYDLNHAIEPDSTYKTNLKGKYEALKQLNEEYDKYIEQYGN